MINYVYGLGGRDVTEDDIKRVFSDLDKIAKSGSIENPITYLGVRE